MRDLHESFSCFAHASRGPKIGFLPGVIRKSDSVTQPPRLIESICASERTQPTQTTTCWGKLKLLVDFTNCSGILRTCIPIAATYRPGLWRKCRCDHDCEPISLIAA